MATIGALNAILSMDSAAFIADTGKARQALGTFAAQANTNLAGIDRNMTSLVRTLRTGAAAFGITFGGAQIISWIRNVSNQADRISDMSEALKVSIGFLRDWERAAVLAGAGTEKADSALSRLNDRWGDAINGSKEAREFFARLGLDVDKLAKSNASLEQIVAEVNEGISKQGNAAAQASMAQDAYGKGFERMLPVIRQGAEGIAALATSTDAWWRASERNITAIDQWGDRTSANLNAVQEAAMGAYGWLIRVLNTPSANSPMGMNAAEAARRSVSPQMAPGRPGKAPLEFGDDFMEVVNITALTSETRAKNARTAAEEAERSAAELWSLQKANRAHHRASGNDQLVGIEQVSVSIDDIISGAPEMGVSVVAALRGIETAALSTALNMEDAFVNFVMTGKLGFHDLATSIIADLARIAARRLITDTLSNVLFNALSGATGGGGLDQTSIDIGYRAAGGPVSAGGMYVVGERGPELFSPSRDGSIIPNGGGEIHVVVHLSDDLNGRIAGISDSRIAGAAPGLISASVVAMKNGVRNRGGRVG